MNRANSRGPAVEFRTLVEMFDKLVEKYADDTRPALMSKSGGEYRGISYAELAGLVERFARGLAELGIRRGDRIALISENRPEWIVADLAMMKLGAVNVSIFPTLAPNQIEYILKDAGAVCAIVSNQHHLGKVLAVIDAVPSLRQIILITGRAPAPGGRVKLYDDVMDLAPDRSGTGERRASPEAGAVGPDDLLTLIYTSGTTGTPKGVMLTHANLVSNIVSSAACIPFTHEDRVLSFLPLSHSYERMAGYYTAMACGVTIAFAETVETLRENLMEVRPTVVMMVPRVCERIHSRLRKHAEGRPPLARALFEWALRSGRRYALPRKGWASHAALSLEHALADRLVLGKIRAMLGGRIRFLVSGGAALAPEIGEFFEAAGIVVIEGYGMTESSPVVSFNRLDSYMFGTVGKPVPGVEVTIGPDGEILVRGPNVMKGYWNDAKSTSEAIDCEGWLHTGDIGTFNEKGFLVITDRKKHLFVTSGGENVAPQAIESLFLQSELIDQFVLIGDGRKFLTALIVPNFGLIRESAYMKKFAIAGSGDLKEDGDLRKLFEAEVNRIQKNLANYERVRKFTILHHPFSIENAELTPTMKIRRKVIEARYKDDIERMYASLG